MTQKKFDECYAIEDNESALDCLKDMVRTATGDCRPKLVLLVQEGCIPCKEETSLHASDIAAGIIQKISVNSPEGLAIAKKNDISLIPSLILLDCKDNLILPSV